jgi:hypothetical protein
MLTVIVLLGIGSFLEGAEQAVPDPLGLGGNYSVADGLEPGGVELRGIVHPSG